MSSSPPIRAHLGRDQGEAEEEDVSAGVGEGPQPGVLLLARRVPQVQRHLLPQHRHLWCQCLFSLVSK